jgi:hypothetical protein
MAHTDNIRGLITYVDSHVLAWQEFRPGSYRKVLVDHPQTGALVMLVTWDAGSRMAGVEHHQDDQSLDIMEGTFVDEQQASGPGTYIHNRVGSAH